MYRRGDIGQVARAMRVLDALRGFKHGRLLSELAAEVDASERTVKRDLAALQDSGIEITRTPIEGRAAACLVERAYSYVAITKRERYTLLAVRAMFDVLRGTSFYDDVASVLRKLEQRMTVEERAEHQTFGERFAYVADGGTKVYEGKEDVLDGLLTGVLSRRVVKFDYRDARGRSQRGHLAPFAMVLYKHGLYVIGRRLRRPEDGASIPDASDVGVFAAERFVSAEFLKGAAFTPPPDFKLSDFLHDAFGPFAGDPQETKQVVIEFDKSKASYVRARLWHRTQEFHETANGLRLEFTCSNLRPVVSWILEWGPYAKVIEPRELVEQVSGELRAALRHYP